MDHVVFYSGGIGSYIAAKRVYADLKDEDRLILLFADTLTEDEDLYEFLESSASVIGGSLIRIKDGRGVWDVFRDVKFLGNSRVDPCSRILKRELLRTWIEERYVYNGVRLYIGIDWTEVNRMKAIKRNWYPYYVTAPLTKKPYLNKKEMIEIAEREGLKVPRLYGMGFPHNNCGGFCVKAGQATFALLLKNFPCRYMEHELNELKLREYLGKDVTIMKNKITLREFREHLEAGGDYDKFDWGGCGCFIE